MYVPTFMQDPQKTRGWADFFKFKQSTKFYY